MYGSRMMNLLQSALAMVYLWATLCLVLQLAMQSFHSHDAATTFIVSVPFAATAGYVAAERREAAMKR